MHYPLDRDLPVDSVTQGFEQLDLRPVAQSSTNPGLNFNLDFLKYPR